MANGAVARHQRAPRLLNQGFFRVGNDRYTRDNHTYGLTTLRRDQVRVDGTRSGTAAELCLFPADHASDAVTG